MAHLTATEANLLAFPLALGLINDTPPAPAVGDTIINTKYHSRTGFVIAERVGTIGSILHNRRIFSTTGEDLGHLDIKGWDTYVTKHAEPLTEEDQAA